MKKANPLMGHHAAAHLGGRQLGPRRPAPRVDGGQEGWVAP
jgi:hypothetical protein